METRKSEYKGLNDMFCYIDGRMGMETGLDVLIGDKWYKEYATADGEKLYKEIKEEEK